MLKQVAYTTVFVSDQDRALDFYTQTLGFERRLDNRNTKGPRFVTVGLPGQEFQLVLWPGKPGEGEPLPTHTPGAYTIDTDDCAKTCETLESRGVEFETGILEQPWGYVAVFRDPDGNRLQVREVRAGR